MKVTLEQRFAVKEVHPSLPPQKKRIAQDAIRVNDVVVGYVGTQANAPLTLIVELDQATIAAIQKAVDERDGTGGHQRVVAKAPTLEQMEAVE